MANRTDPAAKSIRGTNPQNLVEKILRSKIYQNTYWKEQCFGLTAETLVDKAMELDHLGGTFGGNRKPTPFMCLVMKMLQIQPEKDIVVEFIKNEDYKSVRSTIEQIQFRLYPMSMISCFCVCVCSSFRKYYGWRVEVIALLRVSEQGRPKNTLCVKVWKALWKKLTLNHS